MNFKAIILNLELLALGFILIGCGAKNGVTLLDLFSEEAPSVDQVKLISYQTFSQEERVLKKFGEYESEVFSIREEEEIYSFLDRLKSGIEASGIETDFDQSTTEKRNFAVQILLNNSEEIVFYRVVTENKGDMLRLPNGWDFIDLRFYSSVFEQLRNF